MHQIRTHLDFLGYPIVGDIKYGKKDKFNNLFLHSYKLGVHHPVKNKFIEFSAPLPEYFNEFIAERECLP